MICCKIIADFSDESLQIDSLFKKMAKFGDFLWENGAFYFSNTDDINFTEAKLSNVLRRAGVKKFYIQEYTERTPPRESEYVNGWLYDRLMRINYAMCEHESQKVFRDIMNGLDLLDQEIARLRAEQQSDNKEASSDER